MDLASNFVIVTLARSGSYHLVSLLDSAEDIVCHGEVFKTTAISLRKPYLDKLKLDKLDSAKRDVDRAAFLKRLRGMNRFKHVGFKLFPDHMARDLVFADALMADPSWRKIFLFRNPLAVYASLLRARATGLWVVTADRTVESAPAVPSNPTVEFSAKSFEAHMTTYRWFEGAFKKARRHRGNPVFESRHEQLGDPAHLADMLAFIGSSASVDSLVSDKQRQYSAPFEQGFSNWPEFREYLEAHELLDLVPA